VDRESLGGQAADRFKELRLENLQTFADIYDIKELKRVSKRERLDIAVIAVPAHQAQPVVDQAVSAGIKAVLNFSPGALKVPTDVKLKSVDLTFIEPCPSISRRARWHP
jgi:redox-sensing transcriptional repressor